MHLENRIEDFHKSLMRGGTGVKDSKSNEANITKTITIRVPKKDLERLESLAEREERTISGQIRKLIKEYLRVNP